MKTRPRSSVLPSSVRVRPALDRDKEERRRKERRVPYTTSSSLLVLNCPSHAFCTEISGVSFNLYLCPARMSYVKDPFREREGEGTDPPLFERRDERRRRRRRRYLSGLKRAQRLSYVNEEENALAPSPKHRPPVRRSRENVLGVFELLEEINVFLFGGRGPNRSSHSISAVGLN